MTVAELIKALKKMPSDATIRIMVSDNEDDDGWSTSVIDTTCPGYNLDDEICEYMIFINSYS